MGFSLSWLWRISMGKIFDVEGDLFYEIGVMAQWGGMISFGSPFQPWMWRIYPCAVMSLKEGRRNTPTCYTNSRTYSFIAMYSSGTKQRKERKPIPTHTLARSSNEIPASGLKFTTESSTGRPEGLRASIERFQKM